MKPDTAQERGEARRRPSYEPPRLFKIDLSPEKPILLSCDSGASSVETGSCAPITLPGTCQQAVRL